MGNVVCVRDRVSMVHVCLCVIFVAALRDTYTHVLTRPQKHKTHLIRVRFPKHI